MLTGNCLCGAVAFEITGQTTDIYQCHCSRCRKALGTTGVSVFLCSGDDFKWVSGEDQVTLFTTPTGYRSVFCRACGSHLPDPNPDKSTYWVPAGLLDDPKPGLQVGAHMHVDSKTEWDLIGDDGIQYPAGFPNNA